ncbi:MAG: lantibiotic dehydratase [Solirubrobacteraceae bacterium]
MLDLRLGDDVVSTPSATENVPLQNGWTMWPVYVLRTAGLAAERILALSGREQDEWFLPADERRAALAEIATDPWLHEALVWQNPAILRTWLAEHAERLRRGEDRLTRRSYREAMLVRYLQRYCTKNDTIGFFGPISWGTVQPELDVPVDPGVDMGLEGRWVYFEWWAMETLARQWTELPEVRRCLAPRPDPTAVLAGRRLVRMRMRDEMLSAEEAAVFAACDGCLTPDEILSAVRATEPQLGIDSLAQVLAILDGLTQRDRVLWSLELPWDIHQELHLRAGIRRISDGPRRTRLLGELDDLCAARDAVAAAAGDPPALDAALLALDRRFAEITGGPAAREKPDAGVGRRLVWEDTQSSRRMRLSPAVLQDCAPALSLVLEAARWFTWSMGDAVARAARARLVEAPDRRVAMRRLMLTLAPHLGDGPNSALRATVAELQRRAATLLLDGGGGDRDGRPLHPETLREPWAEAFACPGPGWSAARIHCPDLLIDAPDVASIVAGRYRWVLGETHIAVNTVEQKALEQHCPWPGWMVQKIADDLPGTRYVFVPPRDWPGIGPRRWPPVNVKLPSYVYWSGVPNDALDPHFPRLPSGDLDVLLEDDGELIVTTRTGPPLRAPLIEFMGELLSYAIAQEFKLLPRTQSLPRVTVGRTVVQRACRTCPAGELLAAVRSAPGERELVAALIALGVQRFTFVTLPGQAKPIFCDLRNELLMNGLLRILRRSDPMTPATFSEMLPGFDGLWLTDADGHRRTCELRVAVVDSMAPGAFR